MNFLNEVNMIHTSRVSKDTPEIGILIVFSDGPVHCKTLREAAGVIAQKLHLSLQQSYRKLRDGERDFSGYTPQYKIWRVEHSDGIFSGKLSEIVAFVHTYTPDIPPYRIYRRVRRSRIYPVPLATLTAPLTSKSECGKKGAMVSSDRSAIRFSGVEGHPTPVTARELHREWHPSVGKRTLRRRLVEGFRSRADLTAPRLESKPQGRRPGRSPHAVGLTRVQVRAKEQARAKAAKARARAQAKTRERAEELLRSAERPDPVCTTNLPPMRDYIPPKFYIRGT